MRRSPLGPPLDPLAPNTHGNSCIPVPHWQRKTGRLERDLVSAVGASFVQWKMLTIFVKFKKPADEAVRNPTAGKLAILMETHGTDGYNEIDILPHVSGWAGLLVLGGAVGLCLGLQHTQEEEQGGGSDMFWFVENMCSELPRQVEE